MARAHSARTLSAARSSGVQDLAYVQYYARLQPTAVCEHVDCALATGSRIADHHAVLGRHRAVSDFQPLRGERCTQSAGHGQCLGYVAVGEEVDILGEPVHERARASRPRPPARDSAPRAGIGRPARSAPAVGPGPRRYAAVGVEAISSDQAARTQGGRNSAGHRRTSSGPLTKARTSSRPPCCRTIS